MEAKGIGSPEAGIPGCVTCPLWVLETEPMFSVRAASSFTRGAVSQPRKANAYVLVWEEGYMEELTYRWSFLFKLLTLFIYLYACVHTHGHGCNSAYVEFIGQLVESFPSTIWVPGIKPGWSSLGHASSPTGHSHQPTGKLCICFYLFIYLVLDVRMRDP